MNNLQTPGRAWVKQKNRLKFQFPELHDHDFLYEYGNKEDMMNKLQRKIGVTRSDLNELLGPAQKKKYYR